MKQYDVIWIGTGQATLSIVPRLSAAGKTIAVIEANHFGGTCVNTGCTPTKTLVAAAKAIHQTRRGEDFGFFVPEPIVDFNKVMQLQRTTRTKSSFGIEHSLESLANCDVYKGHARFIDDQRVQVGDRQIAATHIVISTGCRPASSPFAHPELINLLDNESLLELDVLPEHLAIIGGSYVGLEFAQIFRRFGSQVSILEHGPQLVTREDKDIAAIVQNVLAAEQIDIHCQCEITALNAIQDCNNIDIHYQQQGQAHSLVASHVLVAIGRVPNSDKLGLENTNITTNAHGYIEVNDQLQTHATHIYAIGDVNGRGAFTHTSVNDGEIFWDHYSRLHGLSQEPPSLDRSLLTRNPIYAMYIDPPLARVGLDEQQAKALNKPVLMATLPMERVARAREKQQTYGLIKILVDPDTEQILGATVFGSGGDEVIGIFAALMQSKTSYKTLRRTVFPHPTVSELLPWILDGLQPL